MQKTTLLVLAVVVALLSWPWGRSADGAEAAFSAASVEALIEQLGSSDYAERESAASRLLAAGMAAEPQLRKALKAPDLEIRLRSDEILSRIYQSNLEQKLADFIDGVEGETSIELPGWKKYRELAGEDRAARQLFVEMFREEYDSLACLDRPQEERNSVLNARVQRIQQEMYGPRGTQAPPPSAIASVLLVSSQQDLRFSIAGIQAYSLLMQTPVMNAIQSGPHKAELSRLLDGWVAIGTKSSNPYYVLMVTMQYDMKEPSLELARKAVAKSGGGSGSMLSNAMLALGKYGGEEDIAILKPLLDNKAVCHTWNNGKTIIYIQVRDVALAVLLHLTRQDHKKYGFDLLRRYDRTLFYIYTCGFADNDKREAAMKKWRDWQAEHDARQNDTQQNDKSKE